MDNKLMNKVHLPIKAKQSSAVAEALGPILIDVLALGIHAKTAHWNLRDSNFIGVHRLLDEVIASVATASDTVAERIRQLGEPVEAPASRISKENRLPEFPSGVLSGHAALTHLCESIQKTVTGVRDGISFCTDTVDEPITADILTSIASDFEKQLWLLDSNLG